MMFRKLNFLVYSIALVIPCSAFAVTPDPSDTWTDYAISMESAHPYVKNSLESREIRFDGARSLKIRFAYVDTESCDNSVCDSVRLLADNGRVIEQWDGHRESFWSNEIPGDHAIIQIFSDSSTEMQGYVIDEVSVLE